MRKARIIILFIVITSFILFSEEIDFNSVCNEITAIYKQILDNSPLHSDDYHILCDQFKTMLLYFLNIDESFNLDIEELLSEVDINEITSDDSQVHVFSCNMYEGGSFEVYWNVIQYRKKTGEIIAIASSELNHKIEITDEVRYTSIDILPGENRKLYLLSGYTRTSGVTYVEVFWTIELTEEGIDNYKALPNDYHSLQGPYGPIPKILNECSVIFDICIYRHVLDVYFNGIRIKYTIIDADWYEEQYKSDINIDDYTFEGSMSFDGNEFSDDRG